jgi:hypothetical protein
MIPINILVPQVSNRLVFTLDWIFKERLNLQYVLITDAVTFPEAKIHIKYGSVTDTPLEQTQEILIPDCGLLWRQGVAADVPFDSFFKDIDKVCTKTEQESPYGFDLFASVFFLLSRYEEYLPYTPDKHNRYPAIESILYKKNILRQPIVDYWVHRLGTQLQSKFNIELSKRTYRYLPTYDIDIAYSYLYKGFNRTLGAMARAFLTLRIKELTERMLTLLRPSRDPFDSFSFLEALHSKTGFEPHFFILSNATTTPFDKNISLKHPKMQQLVRRLHSFGIIGIHPSYYSYKGGVTQEEKEALEAVAGNKIIVSRQHYIKNTIPDTYRNLISIGITEDYSMGYGSHLGFRAGTGASFLWFDILADKATSLRIFPFCFMDATAHFEEKLTVEQAFDILKEMEHHLRATGSVLTTIFHNFSLGTDPDWKGWKEQYESFVHGQTQHDN